jgi:hypothetical protein
MSLMRFIILAGGKYAEHPSSPLHPLQSLGGYTPMVCVLLQSLFHSHFCLEYSVHLLVNHDQVLLFEKTVRMWFPNEKVEIFGTHDVDSSSQAVLTFLGQKTDWEDTTSCTLLVCSHPMISQTTLEHFVSYCTGKQFVTTAIHKTKWNQERHLYNISVAENDSLRMTDIENNLFADIGWVPLIHAPKHFWEHYLKMTVNIREVVTVVPQSDKPIIYYIHSFPLETDSLCIKTIDDKILGSHKFLEKHHVDFLNQCYFIWSECKKLEERIQTLESLIESMKK